MSVQAIISKTQNLEETQSSQDITHLQENVIEAAVPLQAAWKQAWFELPLAVACEAMRFAAHRFHAQGEFIASLEACQSVPEVIEAQARFVRTAVDDYGTETTKIIGDMRKGVSLAA